ncbi:MAG: DNA replication/repair protein RecF [Ruminococcus sp.]|jgi:DNA replication and repair protein RecF|nr:DNA replication/repair protein RecF [Ruminococcus sp.]
MRIDLLEAENFKSIKTARYSFSPAVNILWGDNAQGKTNTLEAMWLLTGVRSFRGGKENAFFRDGTENYRLFAAYTDNLRTCEIEIKAQKNALKAIAANGVPLERASLLFGRLKAVLFTPEDLDLIKGSPEMRRSFLDLAVSQVKPGYAKVLVRYNRVLAQRNAFLKDHFGDTSADTEAWDCQLAKTGAFISVYRRFFCEKLKKSAEAFYYGISGGRDKLSLRFMPSAFSELEIPGKVSPDFEEFYLKKLHSKLRDDLRQGFTSVGIHRDDIALSIDEKPAREFASQGQSRTGALALKLAEAENIFLGTGEMPVIMLDDVFSELDPMRRGFLIKQFEKNDAQVIITTASKPQYDGARVFEVKK